MNCCESLTAHPSLPSNICGHSHFNLFLLLHSSRCWVVGPTKRSFGLVDELTAPLDRWRGTGMVHPWLGVGSAEPSLSSEMSNSAVISTPNINALTAVWTQYSPCHSRVTCTMIIHGEVEWFPGIEFGVWVLFRIKFFLPLHPIIGSKIWNRT